MEKDHELQRNIMDEIRFDPFLSMIAPSIGVTVREGIVTLSGKVDSFMQKHAVEDAAKRVKGVSFVAVDVEVKPGTREKRDDTAIAKAIKDALTHLSILDYDAVDIQVEDGIVTMEGTLRWNYQRDAAEAYVKNVKGVVSVNNNIKLIDVPCDAKTVSEEINAAFHRHATLDAANVRVDIKGRKAVLTGKVRSWAEKKDAENVAWSSPGIKEVDNKIEVKAPYVS